MIAFNRWTFIFVAAIILLITLVQLAHYNSYDTDVLRYVSDKISDGKNKEIATSVLQTVTVTHTAQAATVTVEKVVEVEVEQECEEPWIKKAMWVDAFRDLNKTMVVPDNIHYDVKGPRSDQIVLLTAADGAGHQSSIPGVIEMAMSNRDSYAKHHGYIHHFINISKYDLDDMPAVWKKIPAIVDTFNEFPEAQWVFWLDLDAIIMTPTVDLQSLILSKEGMKKHFHLGGRLKKTTGEETDDYWPREPDFENIDFIVAQDQASINAGSFFLRRSHFTSFLLDIWSDPFLVYADFEQKEQSSMVHLMRHHPTIRAHTGLARQKTINAFAEGPWWMQWEEGDLLIHFAGCWVYDMCAERWEKYWNLRSQLPGV